MLDLDYTMRLRILGLAGAITGLTGCPDDGGDDDAGLGTTSAASSSDDTTGDGPGSTEDGETTEALDTGDTGDTSTGDTGDTSTGGTGDTEDTGDTGDDTTGTTGEEVCTVVLAEIVFDPGGDDDEQQWVKLKNLCSYDIDLAEWTIGYAGEHYGDNRQKQLDGDGEPDVDTVIPGFGCYIVGGPITGDANGMPLYDWPDDFAPGLSYSAVVGSGVALFDLPEAMVDETTIPVDAVVYGPNNDAELIDHTGNAVPAPHVGLPPEGGSIVRITEEPAWEASKTPMAGSCPAF